MGETDYDAPYEGRDPEYVGTKAAVAFARIAHGIAAEMQCGHATEAWNMVAAVQQDMARRAEMNMAYGGGGSRSADRLHQIEVA